MKLLVLKLRKEEENMKQMIPRKIKRCMKEKNYKISNLKEKKTQNRVRNMLLASLCLNTKIFRRQKSKISKIPRNTFNVKA